MNDDNFEYVGNWLEEEEWKKEAKSDSEKWPITCSLFLFVVLLVFGIWFWNTFFIHF